ncbi:MAG: ribbon-helix-helix protein, CopG family [Candidatus Contendobacter sp.]
MASNTVTIRTAPEITRKIEALATAMERSRTWVIEDALKQYLETQAWQIEGIQDAMTALDRGAGIGHEDIMAEMDALIANPTSPTEGRS